MTWIKVGPDPQTTINGSVDYINIDAITHAHYRPGGTHLTPVLGLWCGKRQVALLTNIAVIEFVRQLLEDKVKGD